MEFRDLTTAPDDRMLLRRFYEGLYVAEFPDVDERESLANIERYLDLRRQGWYGNNNYHVGVLLERGEPIGAAIADYLSVPAIGVIEFLVVARDRRCARLGSRLLDWTERRLREDARRGGGCLGGFVAELNDPFKSRVGDSLDPFARLRIWSAWGYAKLDFPYVQPALSPAQKPVRHLLLSWKTDGPQATAVKSDVVSTVVHEYVRWAMRIPDPTRCAEYMEMAVHLGRRADVGLTGLGTYIGEDPDRPLIIREVRTADDPDLDAAIAVYAGAFPPGPTAVAPDEFRRSVAGTRSRRAPATYHLWALRSAAEAPVDGMASFFGLPGAGFGGYVAFGPSLRGTGRLPLLLARIERQLVEDRTGARGWYVECERDGVALARFRQLGFREVAVDYRQPDVAPAADAGVPLALLYKDFGATYGEPVLPVEQFLDALAHVFSVVYRVGTPRAHPLYARIAGQAGQPGGTLAFR